MYIYYRCFECNINFISILHCFSILTVAENSYPVVSFYIRYVITGTSFVRLLQDTEMILTYLVPTEQCQNSRHPICWCKYYLSGIPMPSTWQELERDTKSLYRKDLNKWNFTSSLATFQICVVFIHISRQSKIGHFTDPPRWHKNVTCCQISMYQLKKYVM
jgi:hypothetical protein